MRRRGGRSRPSPVGAPVIRAGVRWLVLLVLLVALAGCATVEHGYDSALLLGDVQAGTGDSLLKRQTSEPERAVVEYKRGSRAYVADRYRPVGGDIRGTLVLVHGFTPYGRRDPRLSAFARSMARSGFIVLVPDVSGAMTGALSLNNGRAIRDALASVGDGAHGYRSGPVGAMAYSFGVGPTLIAASRPAVADDLDFLVAVGGYYDLRDAITYITTGVDPAREGRSPAPRRPARWFFLLTQLPRISDAEDREVLRRIAERRLSQPNASVADLAAELSLGGRAVYQLMSNNDPGRVADLMAALPRGMRAQINGLDLAQRDLTSLDADVVLIHGRDDDVIPISHSERLKAAIGPERVRLYRAGGLKHVDVAPGLWDSFALWRAAIHILDLAERHAGG